MLKAREDRQGTRSNKILPVVPASLKKYLFSFYDGEPNSTKGGKFITDLVKDYLIDPDRYLARPVKVSELITKKEKQVILTVSMNENDYKLYNKTADLELRSLNKQGTWILASIALTLQSKKVKQIIRNDSDKLNFK